MPDAIRNGVYLPALPQIISPEQIAKTKKLANRYFKAREVIDYSKNVTEKIVIPIILIVGFFSSIIRLLIAEFTPIGQRNIVVMKDSKNFVIPKLNAILGCREDVRINENVLIYMDSIVLYTASILSMLFMIKAVKPLENYLEKKHSECINIINRYDYPRYEDIKFYKKTLKVDKTDICPISYANVNQIKQKVFYRSKIFDYHCLILDCTSRLNARDHTGQLYDKSLFFRVDDKKIMYIHVVDENARFQG
jgi:hypothetical protein